MEHIWDDLREKEFHNLVFDSLDSLEDHLKAALLDMENDQDRIHSIVAWPWIINALLNQKWNKTEFYLYRPSQLLGKIAE